MSLTMMVPKALAGDNNVLRGTLNLSRSELAKYAPHYTGQTQIFVLKQMRMLTESKDPIALKHAANLKNLIEFCSLSYSGTPDLSGEDATVETGYSNVEISVPTGTKYDGTSFSIRILEQNTEVLRHALEYIQNNLFNPYSNVATMAGTDLELSPENYTMEIGIVQLNPKLDKIQDISIWQAARPKPVDRDNLNWQQGQVEIVQPKDVQFSGRYIANADQYINQLMPLVNQRIALHKAVNELIL